MKVSPHTHCESPLTGSTIANLVSRAKEIGRTHFAYTDHGHLSSALKVQKACKGAKLQFIPGIEVYFKDVGCPITTGTPADRCKYFTIALYCHDQAAYQELSRTVSRTDFPTMEIYDEKQSLWSWADLEHMSKFNVSIVLGGVHCIVGKTVLAGSPELGDPLMKKLTTLFKDRVTVAMICEEWTRKWNSVVEIVTMDEKRYSCLSSDLVTTDKARRIKATDLIDRPGHSMLMSIVSNGTVTNIGTNIKEVKLHKGFLPLPGGDATLRVNQFLYGLAKRYNAPVIASDYSYYAKKEDKIVQTMRLEGNDKLQPNFHLKEHAEFADYLLNRLGMTMEQGSEIIRNTDEWASKFDGLQLKYDWRLATIDGDPLRLAMDIIKQNGRMKWNNPVWVARLKEELEVIAKNPKKDLTAYFLPIRDVLNHYKENGLLTGPGRGSAGGSLFCYLLGITQIDPFKYDLPFSRFFSLDRIMTNKLPDIDVDLEDRELLVGPDAKSGYLYGRWGDKAAQISTRHTLRLKSTIKDTNRYFHGAVQPEIEKLTEGLPDPPQGVTDTQFVFGFEDDEGVEHAGIIETSEELKKYSEARPKEWEIVSKAMGLTRAFSQHASAFVLSDVPIKDVVPTKEGNITQYEAKECEAAGLIKYDFLVVKQLKDIRVCLDLINKRNNEKNTVGYFTYNGKQTYIWDLPEELGVFQSVWKGSTETGFQINSRSMTPFVMDILPTSVMDVATILALVRPGPLDFIDPDTGRTMADEYVLRRKGQAEAKIKELEQILPKTYGIFVYQEDLTKIAKELAGFNGVEAEQLRENMAKKKKVELMNMKPQFVEGASKKVSKEVAEEIWNQMETFGRYGFSIIHAVEYAHITYACMFLKHHYPLEWWAAILSNADEGEITGTFWPYVRDMVSPPDINLSTDQFVVDYKNEKLRAKLGVIKGLGEATITPLVANRPYADIHDFINKEVAGQSLSHKLIHVGVLDSLFPAKTNLAEKLKIFEDAVESKAYAEKLAKAKEEGRKLRALAPRPGKIPEQYLNLTPLKDAAMRKSVLPTLPIDFHEIGKKYSKAIMPFANRPMVKSPRGYETLLINGRYLQRLDETPGDDVQNDVYVASTCFVIEAKEFSYPKKNPTKRALKLVLDSDGYVSEKVLWPEYETGKLAYPPELKKGTIATVFFRKRAGRKDMSITGIVVES